MGKNRRPWEKDLYPWVFDMKFALVGGKAWLLAELVQSKGPNKAVATATVREARLNP